MPDHSRHGSCRLSGTIRAEKAGPVWAEGGQAKRPPRGGPSLVVVVVVGGGAVVVVVVVVVGGAVVVVGAGDWAVAVVGVVDGGEVAGGIEGGRANWAKPGWGLPLILLNSPPTKMWSAPTATEYGPVGVSATGFQGSSSPVAASKALRWRRAVPSGQYW